MKNKTLLSELNQAAFKTESATRRNRAKSDRAAFKTESKTAIFRPALLSFLNTYIDLAIGKGFPEQRQHSRQEALKHRAAHFGLKTAEGRP